MAFIDITTNNLSRQLVNSVTNVDNWVYVPGTAITGDWKRPYAFRSLEDFQATCGTKGPEGSITYEYVAGLLSAGLPVLFRRIAYVDQDEITEEQILAGTVTGVKRAFATITHTIEESEPIKDVTFTEKFGGTFGNDMYITTKIVGTSYYIEVYYKSTLLEKQKIATIPSSVIDQTEINRILIKGLMELNNKLERITVDVENDDVVSFIMPIVDKLKLENGEDIEEALIGNEIPKSLKFIEDKILYQPKFITSGGYTDENMESSHEIADAMLALTRKRQDCRALIDLPIGTAAHNQQTLASLVKYQQNSDTDPIPSGSICAPWAYTQVGNEQLWMPPSYLYLTVVGNELGRGGKVYTPKAGITNGTVSNIIKPEFEIGSALSEAWQSDSDVNINPIMRLQSGNYVIAGNSTLLTTDTELEEINAFQESSADLTIIEIRRFVYNLATELRYQYNSTEAFETFSIRTAKFLNAMISEGAMSDYVISNISSNNEPRTLAIQLDVYLTPTIKKIKIFLNVSYGNIEVSTGGVE